MGPSVASAAELNSVLNELRAREPIFHKPEFWKTRADFAQLMHESYWEVGASGKRYSRDFILNLMETRAVVAGESAWVVSDFQVREIAPDNYLATYTLLQAARLSRRSTLWRRTATGWRILYHQGTLAAAQP
jgi:hypothetical protein